MMQTFRAFKTYIMSARNIAEERTTHMKRRLLLALVLGVAVAAPAAQPLDFARGALSAAEGQQVAAPAQDADILARIRKEGMDNSQIMRTMHYLTDVYGPRPTGSPNHQA